MRQFKINHTRYKVPIEYKSTPEYKKAIDRIKIWKQHENISEALDLSRLKLRWLPSLPNNLQKLYCFDNHLTSLPYLPTTLEYINCGVNKITSLPHLPNSLQVLSCVFNKITSLPKLPIKLQVLHCVFNKITSLPKLPKGIKTICYK
jgi:Leucine-rich repeat (LRR) protein